MYSVREKARGSLWKEKGKERRHKGKVGVGACSLGGYTEEISYPARISEAFISGHRRLLRADFRVMVREVILGDITEIS